MAKRVLVVEDDPLSANKLIAGLSAAGYDVFHADSVDLVLGLTKSSSFDAIILDRLLGDVDAAQEIGGWRQYGIRVPIMVVSSMIGLRDRVDGLHAGADAYMTKPVDIDELNAKLNALVRMGERHSAGNDPDLIRIGNLTLDRRRREARCCDQLIALHPREFKLLEELALHAGSVVSRTSLLEKVWNLRFDPRTKLIESHMSRLRAKLEFAATSSAIITVRGSGYCLCDGDSPRCQ